jgi:hypothetical protein
MSAELKFKAQLLSDYDRLVAAYLIERKDNPVQLLIPYNPKSKRFFSGGDYLHIPFYRSASYCSIKCYLIFNTDLSCTLSLRLLAPEITGNLVANSLLKAFRPGEDTPTSGAVDACLFRKTAVGFHALKTLLDDFLANEKHRLDKLLIENGARELLPDKKVFLATLHQYADKFAAGSESEWRQYNDAALHEERKKMIAIPVLEDALDFAGTHVSASKESSEAQPEPQQASSISSAYASATLNAVSSFAQPSVTPDKKQDQPGFFQRSWKWIVAAAVVLALAAAALKYSGML